MATVEVSTIGIDGGSYDYASASAWWAAEGGDLVSADVVAIGEYQGDWSSSPDSGFDITSGTTDATRYAVLRTDSANRHSLERDDTLAVIDRVGVYTEYIRLEGLQILDSVLWHAVHLGAGGDNSVVDSCFIELTGYSGVTSNGINTLTVNTAITGPEVGLLFGNPAGAGEAYFSSISADYGVRCESSASAVVRNNILYAATSAFNSSGSLTASNNATNQASCPGSDNILNISDPFVDLANDDLNTDPADTDGLAGSGYDLSGLGITTDALGQDRPSDPTIGATELDPGSGGLSVSPSSTTSQEAFGGPNVDPGLVSASPSSIPSSEAFGSTVLSTGVVLTPAGVASSEAFGLPTLSAGLVEVLPGSITSEAAFGSPTLNQGLVLAPSGLTGQETFGSPVLSPGSVSIVIPGISSTESLGSVTLSVGELDLSPAGIPSGEAFGTSVLSTGLILNPSGISSNEAFGDPALTEGTVSVTPSSVSSEEVFGDPIVGIGISVVQPSGITTDEALGAAELNPGPVSVSPSGIASAEAFGSDVVVPGPINLAAFGIASSEIFGVHTIGLNAWALAPSGITSGEFFGSPALSSGPVGISTFGLASAEAFGVPSVGFGGTDRIFRSIYAATAARAIYSATANTTNYTHGEDQ